MTVYVPICYGFYPKMFWGHFIQSDKQQKKMHRLHPASVSASDGTAT